MAQPPGALNGRLRLTEQGEAAFARYANPQIAHRHLEQTINAVLRSSLGVAAEAPSTTAAASRGAPGAGGAGDTSATASPAGEPRVEWLDALELMSRAALAAYRGLVYDDPGFIAYFHDVTPIDQIADLRIGSRPAKRKVSDRIQDLRAIPWVFSWTQSRHGLPGWYGLGAAADAYVAQHGPVGWDQLAAMYRGWPFFRSLIDNAQLGLAKADQAVARLYAGLCPDETLRGRVFAAIDLEWHRTEDAVTRISGSPALLSASPVLSRSIRLRNPYVDPMSFVQVSLLSRLRAAQQVSPDGEDGPGTRVEGIDAGGGQEKPDEGSAHLRRLVALTINGVAAGLQNTG
jgi:phosphoenolpyruvate carboxylase